MEKIGHYLKKKFFHKKEISSNEIIIFNLYILT